MIKASIKNVQGFGLTEGLISLVVLSAGLLAIYGVHTDLIRSFEDDKTRTEALYLTSQKISEIRDDAADGVISTVAGNESIAGQTATFSQVTGVASSGSSSTFTITTSWDGLFGEQSVQLQTVVMPLDPVVAEDITQNGNDPTGTANLIATPQGSAEYGNGRVLTDEELSGKSPELNKVEGVEDGTKTLQLDDGKYYLIDSDNTVLLKSNNPFVTINGRLYKDASWPQSLGDLFIGAPDISICKTIRGVEGGGYGEYSKSGLTTNVCTGGYWTSGSKAGQCKEYTEQSNQTVTYDYALYRCYVGSDWYGSIAVTDQVGAGDNIIVDDGTVCLGDPNQTIDDTATDDFSTYPVAKLSRQYRGYKLALDADGDAVDASGAKVDLADSEGAAYFKITGTPTCSEINASECTFSRHDFVVKSIADDCPNTMTVEFDGEIPSGNSGDDSFNPGARYCLPGDICPPDVDSAYAYKITVSLFMRDETKEPALINNENNFSSVYVVDEFSGKTSICEYRFNNQFDCDVYLAGSKSSGIFRTTWSGTVYAETTGSCIGVNGDNPVSKAVSGLVPGDVSTSLQFRNCLD